jgi:hypothetical protein
MGNCKHDGFHTGQGRYSPDSGQIRYVMICDECQQELAEVHRLEYRPSFDPHGNDSFLTK